jgi:integrase
MARKTASPPTFDKKRNRWRVTIPATLSPEGKRLRSWHLTRDAARDYLSSLVSGPEPSAIIPPKLAMKADEARLILEPHHLDLVEAAKMLAAVIDALGGSGTPLDAARAYRLVHDQRSASKTFGEAQELFMLTREGLREDTLRGYRHHLKNVFASLHDRTMSDITIQEIDAILAPRPPSSRKAAQTTLGCIWRWAASPPRQWCGAALVDALEPVRINRETEITTLAPDAVEALLRAAETTGPGCAVGFAVGIFAGVRLRELSKLTWGNVTPDHIEISATIAKRHARRLIPVCPTLKAWIDAYRPADAEDDDLVTAPNWINTARIARRRAGWNLLTNPPLRDAPPITRGEWPQNAMRHTCASIQVAIGKPLDDLIFSFGHSGGTALLKQHYLGKLTKKDALAILAIGPNGSKVSNIQAA